MTWQEWDIQQLTILNSIDLSPNIKRHDSEECKQFENIESIDYKIEWRESKLKWRNSEELNSNRMMEETEEIVL